PPASSLVPYTTLFRSLVHRADETERRAHLIHGVGARGVQVDRGPHLGREGAVPALLGAQLRELVPRGQLAVPQEVRDGLEGLRRDRKSTRLNSSHVKI